MDFTYWAINAESKRSAPKGAKCAALEPSGDWLGADCWGDGEASKVCLCELDGDVDGRRRAARKPSRRCGWRRIVLSPRRAPRERSQVRGVLCGAFAGRQRPLGLVRYGQGLALLLRLPGFLRQAGVV